MLQLKFFIAGYYGYKNLGDELYLLKILNDIKKLFPFSEFYIWSADKNFSKEFLKDYNVKIVDRYNPSETVNSIKTSDVVILGGGGLIHEYYGLKVESLFKNFGYDVPSYAIPALIGKIFNKKVFYWGLGHGPVVTEEGLEFSRWFYSLADVITLRDPFSYYAVKKLLPEKEEIYLDSDPLLNFDFNKYQEKTEKGILGISVRKWFNDEIFIETIVQVLNDIIKETSIKIFPIPCDLLLDKEITSKFSKLIPKEHLIEKDFNSIDEVIKGISICEWFIGMRLHSLITAYKLRKPLLAISYDAKVEEFMKEIKGDYIKITDFSKGEIFFKIKNLLTSKPLPIKEFSYKTPEIFEKFLNKGKEDLPKKEVIDFINNSENLEDKEKVYLRDFVKTLFLQREELYGKINVLNNVLTKIKGEKNELLEKIKRLEEEKKDLLEKIKRLEEEKNELAYRLSEIYNSNFWKLAQKYYYLRDHSFLKHFYPLYKPILDRIFKKSVKEDLDEKEIKKEENLKKFLGKAENLVIIISSLPFNEQYNQRPFNISKELSKSGYRVLFVCWQWSPDEIIPESYQEVYENIFQIPIYDFLNNHDKFSYFGKEKILYLTFPAKIFYYSFIRFFRYQGFKIIYDIMDDWEGFYEIGQAPWYVKEMEEKFILEADYVLVVNEYLQKKFYKLRKDLFIIGNGYSEEILGVNSKFIAGKDLDNNENFIIGYYGWLVEERFDWEFIFKVAEAYKNIEIQLLGYAISDKMKKKLNNYSNIKFFGIVNPRELKNYIVKWNVGIIPFTERKISKGSDPLKIYEYIYFGLPTAVKGFDQYKNVPFIFYLNNVNDIQYLISEFNTKEKIQNFREKYKDEIEKFLALSNWKSRVNILLEFIKGDTFWC